MAERYQDRPFPSDDYGRGDDQHGKAESDPLAELARLIGQTDPFAAQSRPTARPPAAPAQSFEDDDYRQLDDLQDNAGQAPPPGPPSWMRRANVQPAPAPEPDYPVTVSPVHPLHRYAAKPAAPEPVVHQPQAHQDTYQDQAHQEQAYQQHGQAYQEQSYQEPYAQPDPSRYDDALYGRLETGEQDYQREPAYPDDPYAYQSDYPEDEVEEPKKQRGGMMTVAAILALAVVGTGAAFAYKTYIGSPRSGEPPIIKADNTPTKIVPAPTDSSAKVPDRMVSGDGTEKIVPREEAPVDVNAKAGGPRVVFPPLNQNANPPSVASVSPSNVPPPSAGPTPSNGTLPNNSPRPIRTVAVKGDQTDSAAPQSAAAKPAPAAPKPVAAPVAPAAPRNPPTSANASANQPMSLAPQSSPAAEPPQRMAATNPVQIAPTSSSGGGYIVQVSSQQSEDSAAASYRVLQSKYGSVLGSRSPVIKRVDLTDKGKGIVYRAFAGPYGSVQEATQACNNLKAAGLSDCFVQRN
ncbi:SPOR domain-containing protein [Bradyrhizobium sp. CNPSo 4010]|uniref:SPOR domain-containing protein n=1 Tax=Bradyrhizobium agreste TaxID=2751811 RepID=A0ABS0PMJ7_9BRAD|nr:SPOR domain-containing protein [Bradyrhizobium agreste]MBH5398102.1 SPOR domain-containing protein [Bradyrhizobium agreste]